MFRCVQTVTILDNTHGGSENTLLVEKNQSIFFVIAPTGALYMMTYYIFGKPLFWDHDSWFMSITPICIDFHFDWQWHCHGLILFDADWSWLILFDADWSWLMLMLMLWPLAVTPGVTHFGAYHRPPDDNFLISFWRVLKN